VSRFRRFQIINPDRHLVACVGQLSCRETNTPTVTVGAVISAGDAGYRLTASLANQPHSIPSRHSGKTGSLRGQRPEVVGIIERGIAEKATEFVLVIGKAERAAPLVQSSWS